MAASPSFMKAVFVYSEDSHLALRQAAARGDNHKIKALFQNKKLENIDQPGADSGKTALHQAAAKGKKETVKLLISLGANPTIQDKSGQSAKELAVVAEHEAIACLLQQTEYAYQAIQVAKAIFYISDDNPIERNIFDQGSSRICHDCHKEIERKLVNIGEINRILLLCLIEIKAYLTAAKNSDYRIGLCGELTRACFAHLLSIEPILSIAKFKYYNKNDSRRNHTFVALNLDECDNIHNPNTWGSDTLICDPYALEKDRLYFINYAPQSSAVNEMKTVDTIEPQFCINPSIVEKLQQQNPSLAKEARTLIQHNYDLLSALQSPQNRSHFRA